MPTPRPFDETAIDCWVQACLRERHEPVTGEPIPDALLRLLQEDHES